MHARDNLRVGDLLEVERERLAALIRVVETVLDCVCWGLSNCVSERCGGCKQNIECGKQRLTHEGEPATDERAGARLARTGHQTRHTLVRLDVGDRAIEFPHVPCL